MLISIVWEHKRGIDQSTCLINWSPELELSKLIVEGYRNQVDEEASDECLLFISNVNVYFLLLLLSFFVSLPLVVSVASVVVFAV